MKPPGPGLLYAGRFLITVSVSKGVFIFKGSDFSFIFFLNQSIIDLQSCISFKWESVIYSLLLRFFYHIGHCRVLSRLPCAIQ